jgi:hypothetical protein
MNSPIAANIDKATIIVRLVLDITQTDFELREDGWSVVSELSTSKSLGNFSGVSFCDSK